MSITLIIIIITGLVSYQCFNDPVLKQKLLHHPYSVMQNKEYYRWVTSGFIHADWGHLLINMFVFYSFGQSLELELTKETAFGPVMGGVVFLLFYICGIIFADLPYFSKHKDNPHNASLGASGAVAAVLFANILYQPWGDIIFVFLPFIPIKSIVFALLYLAYETYALRRNSASDRVNHLAHIFGAIFGVLGMMCIQPHMIPEWSQRLMDWPF